MMAILVFAGVLSVPSAVFAEASWYGSLRAGVMSSDSNVSVFDGGSRWGIKGSNEAGEGLTAVYRFEHKISTVDAGQPAGRLAYVGLSGGFGTVTAGQIWSAAYNSAGAVTDNSWFWGDSQTSYRHGQAVSYAFANDLMSLQADMIYGGADEPEDLQKAEFGLSVNVGDMGKVALAHTDDKYSEDDLGGSTAGELDAGDTSWRTKTATLAAEVSVSNLTAYAGTQSVSYDCTGVYVDADSGFSGPCTNSNVKAKEKTSFFGVRGGLGDTGVSYVFQWRDVKSSNQKPWLLSLTKGLGDSAALIIEHADNDDSANKSGVALAVHF